MYQVQSGQSKSVCVIGKKNINGGITSECCSIKRNHQVVGKKSKSRQKDTREMLIVLRIEVKKDTFHMKQTGPGRGIKVDNHHQVQCS